MPANAGIPLHRGTIVRRGNNGQRLQGAHCHHEPPSTPPSSLTLKRLLTSLTPCRPVELLPAPFIFKLLRATALRGVRGSPSLLLRFFYLFIYRVQQERARGGGAVSHTT